MVEIIREIEIKAPFVPGDQKILFINNQDSFVYNLVNYICTASEAKVKVVTNDISISAVTKYKPDKIFISPGPGHPKYETGNTIPIIQKFAPKVPIFGVCLGHQAICEAFGKIGTDNALEALPAFFTDEYFFVRYYAAEAVVLGGERAAPYLINVLEESTDVRARALAARALGAIKSPQAVQPLIRTLQDRSPTLRRLAIWSLGNIGSADGWLALQDIKKRGSWSERKHARYALDKIARHEIFEQERPGNVMY